MIDQFRRSARSTVDAERLKVQAAAAGLSLADASAEASRVAAQLAEQAREAAAQARLWAVPRVEAAREWTTPRVEKAIRESAHAAAPRVEKAARGALPIVDTAHDRLVQDLLPKVVAAVNAAALAATTGADKARDVTSARLSELAHIQPPEPPKSHRGAKIFWFITGVAAVGAAAAAWRSSQPMNDPWAEQPWEPVGERGSDRIKARAAEAREELGGVVTDVRHDAWDAAEHVGEVAGGAVARTREAGERAKEARDKVAERAREATEKAREVSEKALEATKKAAPRRRASSEGIVSDAGLVEDPTEEFATSGLTGSEGLEPSAIGFGDSTDETGDSTGDATTGTFPPPGEATPADLDPAHDDNTER